MDRGMDWEIGRWNKDRYRDRLMRSVAIVLSCVDYPVLIILF
jgi:hypothetical protein